MPPKALPARRAPQAQPEKIYALGQAGRKTGIVLQDTGERDEHGFENPDIFSSPEKDAGTPDEEEDEEDDSGQEMELDNEDEPGPATIRRGAQQRPSLPRARSPLKTNLLSPAKHSARLNPSSSPTRGDVYHLPRAKPHEAVNRLLNFGASKNAKLSPEPIPKVNGSGPQRSPFMRPPTKPGAGLNGRTLTDDEDESEIEEEEQPDDLPAMGDDDVDLGTYMGDDEPAEQSEEEEEEPEEEPEEEAEPEPEEEIDEEPEEPPVVTTSKARKPSAKSARPQAHKQAPVEEVVKPAKPRGRPPKVAKTVEPKVTSPKRSRDDREPVEERSGSEEDAPGAKRTKTSPAPKIPKGKPGRKRKSSGVGVEPPAIQRGPPLPKARGLVSIRREGPNSMLTTRSGRHSFKPLNWWQGDQRELETEEYTDIKGQKFVLNSTKSVVRYENEDKEQPSRRRGGRTGRGGKVVSRRSETAIEREPWETSSGRIVGECLYWYPEYETNPPLDDDPVEVMEEELAISEPAIQLKDIKDATFKFAKTLTLPFFGSGIVDLPPGSEKRSKNSRKMQMVFFVHRGTVDVIVATNEFTITEGGQFFVPRGNYYSMENNGNVRARIFFAQGCEQQVLAEDAEPEGESQVFR